MMTNFSLVKNKKELVTTVFSDIHLGHPLNRTGDIINRFKECWDKYKIDNTDILVIAGDIFHKLVDLDNRDTLLIIEWVYWVMKKCQDNHITLRVLKGTPSHDWNQNRLFSCFKDKFDIDYKYIEDIEIEYMTRFDINVLYIPDEARENEEKTWLDVQDLMRDKQLNAVDYAFMHGQFEFQLPKNLLHLHHHDHRKYESIVSKLCCIGHVHVHSHKGKIVAQGSFDRQSHGEESDKGFVQIYESPNKVKWYFRVNENARKYITCDIVDCNAQESFEKIKKLCDTLPEFSCVRLLVTLTNSLWSNTDSLLQYYPTFRFTTKLIEKNKIETKIDESIHQLESIKTIELTKDNIERELFEWMKKNKQDFKDFVFASECLRTCM